MAHSAHLNFYGDDSTRKNYLFSFKVDSEKEARAGLRRFEKMGIKIRSAYFTIKRDGAITSSLRLM